MDIHILTAFPQLFNSPLNESILKRAQEKNLVTIHIHDLRKWTKDERKTIDGRPFGGGPGMVLLLEPIYQAVAEIKTGLPDKNVRVLLTSAKGAEFNQPLAQEFSKFDALIIICGHYEGVDERVAKYIADLEISVGRFVLTGGELAAMIIADAVIRLIPDVLGNRASLLNESFNQIDQTEAPQYTRPSIFTTDSGEEWKVPDVLLSGNHKDIDEWRAENSKLGSAS